MTQQMTFDPRVLKAEAPEQLMAGAMAFLSANTAAWGYIVARADDDVARYGIVRIKRIVEDLRMEPLIMDDCRKRPKVPNAYSAAFGRMLVAWHQRFEGKVPLNHSKLDGCTIPAKPSWAVGL